MADERNEEGKFIEGNGFSWKAGQSGNPNGRPKGAKGGSSVLRKMARALIDSKTGLTASELISAKLIAAAMDGQPWAVKEYFDRVEGRPGTRLEVEEELSWQELAQLHGLSEEDVIQQARKLIESGIPSSDTVADQEA